ncbi:3-ketoacyl-CoA synthase 7-like [Nymphaea colorata]|nr:3-ketoacyl-CoA synthase 7-like [Nymphaea colorata]
MLFSLLLQSIFNQLQETEVTNLYCFIATLLGVVIVYFLTKKIDVYLVDFVCYQPPDDCRETIATYHEHMRVIKHFDDESMEFQLKILRSSGIGNESCAPFGLHQLPPDLSLAASIEEVETIAFSVAEDLFDKHNINPKSVDILISNCGHFSPTPSICSMIRNRFDMKSNLMSFNLSGMGCSSGIISICLAKDLLRVHKNSLALVLSFEAISSSGYRGKIRSMLLTNCLFRMGGAAILLGNRVHDKEKAKYVLEHAVRSHGGADDDAHGCVTQQTDRDGEVGFFLSKKIMIVAKDVLEANILAMGPLILPLLQKIRWQGHHKCN